MGWGMGIWFLFSRHCNTGKLCTWFSMNSQRFNRNVQSYKMMFLALRIDVSCVAELIVEPNIYSKLDTQYYHVVLETNI